MGLQRGFKAEANRIALRVRAAMGLADIAPIDPALVCAHFDIRLLPLSEVNPDSQFLEAAHSSAFSAVTVPCGFHTAILHNDSHHPHRQRSNVCHELAHCFLGHESAPPLADDGERTRDGTAEAEAAFLSGVLLLPNEAANHVVRSGLMLQAQRIYGISQAMLTYRLRVSGAHLVHERRMRNVRGQASARG